MPSTTTFHMVRQGTAAKLGANSTGTISYAVLIDADRTEPFIALTGNDGGGYFSREAAPISALRRCAGQTNTDKPLGASAFKPAFVGRSTNNGYCAVAAWLRCPPSGGQVSVSAARHEATGLCPMSAISNTSRLVTAIAHLTC